MLTILINMLKSKWLYILFPFINYCILWHVKDINDGWTNADDEFKKQFGAKLSPQFSFLLKQLGLSDDQYIDKCYDFIIFFDDI